MSGMERDVVISVRGLRNQFGAQVVHDQLDLDIYAGEVLGIVGGSGTGKSVLLRTILGLNKPAMGRIEIFGKARSEMSPEDEHAVERRWGVLFQDGALFSSLTVAQNIQVALKEHLHLPQKLMNEIAAVKIGLVGLPPDAGPKFPSELSGGMRKRAGLDPIGASAFDELIKNLQATLGLTVFMVTHDLDSLYAICNRIAVLAEKKVIVTGTIEQMLTQEHPWIREYFHGPRGRAAMAAKSAPPRS